MTLTVVEPRDGASIGYGCRMRVHTDLTISAGAYIIAVLYWTDAVPIFRYLCKAIGELSVGSGSVDLFWGYDSTAGVGVDPPSTGPAGAALGASISLYLQHWNASFELVEDLRQTNNWLHDPVSQAPSLALLLGGGAGHDPMLDEILAAVRTDFPTADA